VLLEVGAGTAEYVARLLRPSAEQYFYVGTDIAREALLIWVFGWFLKRSVLLTWLVLWLDERFLRSIGQVARRLGPAEVIGIFEKSHSGDHGGRSQDIRQNIRPE
jgi:hypothetical protein